MSVTPTASTTRTVTPRWTYTLAGIRIASDIPLRDLAPVIGAPNAPTLAVRACAPAALPPAGVLLREVTDSAGERYAFRTYQAGRGFLWRIKGIGDFHVHENGSRISYALLPGALRSDVEHVILGPVLGSALHLRGVPLLHAGAVVVDDAAVAVTAPSGFGKSTLVAQLAALGLPVLTDDTLPVTPSENAPIVEPYIPRMKLWDDALDALGHDPDVHATAISWLEKRRVRMDGTIASMALGQYPLRSIYLLSPRLAGAPVTFRTLEGHEAVLSLLASMYLPELLCGLRALPAFRAATAIVRACTVRSVSYPRTFEALPTLACAIVEDARAS